MVLQNVLPEELILNSLIKITLRQLLRLTIMSTYSKAWKWINRFKLECLSKGWKTSESYDWVLTENEEYHALVWVKIVLPSSFERIALDRKCIVKEGLRYRVVKAAYCAWIFVTQPPESLLEKIWSNEEILYNNAIYDLSRLCKGEKVCRKINKTKSRVFKEFEKFLKKQGITIIECAGIKPSIHV